MGNHLSHQWERTFATVALQMPYWVGATKAMSQLPIAWGSPAPHANTL